MNISAVINIEIENNADDELQLHPKLSDDNLLGAIPMDGASMMLVDEMLDFMNSDSPNQSNDARSIYMPTVNEKCSSNAGTVYNQQPFAVKEELHSSSDGDAGSDTPFDPNDFFNDLYKSEVSYSPFSSPLYRNTPSPSNSQSSGSDQSVECNSLVGFQQQEATINLHSEQQQLCRSEDIVPEDFTQNLQPVIPIYNQMTTGGSANNINIIQGTLIPIKVSLSPPHSGLTTVTSCANQSPMKKIKIQPKPVQAMNGAPSIHKSNAKPKTIILSANDYKALMLKCKSQKSCEKIAPLTLKASPTLPAIVSNGHNISTVAAPTTKETTKAAKVMPVKTDGVNISSLARVNGIKQEIDDRTLKKQLRMIKNRESACLSRKKKKDYVTSLEARISDLSKENQQLKAENSVLKDRLDNIVNQVCNLCGGLNSYKMKSGPISALSNVPKKNAAFLLALVFMVSLHVGPYLTNPIPNLRTGDDSIPMSGNSLTSRHLLWIDDAANDSSTSPTSDEDIKLQTYPMCPVSVNQTESVRLASELKRWISDFPEYFNISQSSNSGNSNNFDLNEISDYLLSDDGGRAIKSFYKKVRKVGRHIKRTIEDRARSTRPLYRKVNANRADTDIQSGSTDGNESRVQVYNADAIKYAGLFEEIRRQDDTFYVVSFKGDHLLLPAVAHNNTLRPKMSLMLPAVGNVDNGTYNSNGMFTLMQIDCEVVNTSILHIKESVIPDHLWNRSPSKKSADENSVPAAESATEDAANTQQIIQNLSPGPGVLERINRNRFPDNATSANRRRPHVLAKNVVAGVTSGDAAAADVHVDPLKPHRPYFLHDTGNTNIKKQLRGL